MDTEILQKAKQLEHEIQSLQNDIDSINKAMERMDGTDMTIRVFDNSGRFTTDVDIHNLHTSELLTFAHSKIASKLEKATIELKNL